MRLLLQREKRLKTYLALTPAQRDYLDSPSIFRAFVGGRGAGKSFVGAYDLIKRLKANCHYLVAAPTYQMLRDATMASFRTLCERLNIKVDHHKADMQATMPNGAEILFRSTDNPDRLRGPNLSGVWLDEASVMEQEAYEIVMASLRENGIQGWMGTTFTPKGLSHWTFQLFNSDRPDTTLIRSKTFDNPFLPEDFAETIRKQYSPALAQQELEGMFVSIEGAEWPPEAFDHGAFWFDIWPATTVKTMFLDPSKGARDKAGDYSAIIIFGRDGHKVEYVEADLRRRPPDVIVDDCLELIKRHRPDAFGIEGNAFQDLLAPMFRRRAEEMGVELPTIKLFNNITKKVVRIRRLTEPICQKNMRFKSNSKGTQILVDQLRQFPNADHDDGPDALEGARRLAVEMVNSGVK